MNFHFNLFVVNVRRVSRSAEVYAHKRRLVWVVGGFVWRCLRMGAWNETVVARAALLEQRLYAYMLGREDVAIEGARSA